MDDTEPTAEHTTNAPQAVTVHDNTRPWIGATRVGVSDTLRVRREDGSLVSRSLVRVGAGPSVEVHDGDEIEIDLVRYSLTLDPETRTVTFTPF